MSASHRVLVVEDHGNVRESLGLLLRAWGHHVEVAEDGEAGVNKAMAWKPEVAVVDLGLPLLDGLQVARKVKAAFPDAVRLIALTAHEEERDRALAAGFDHFLAKPVDLDELRR